VETDGVDSSGNESGGLHTEVEGVGNEGGIRNL
jgi:hypothetical protein